MWWALELNYKHYLRGRPSKDENLCQIIVDRIRVSTESLQVDIRNSIDFTKKESEWDFFCEHFVTHCGQCDDAAAEVAVKMKRIITGPTK